MEDTDKMNINERIAEVMGWRLEQRHYVSGGSRVAIECNIYDWHPDTDINQAMMCAEKLNIDELSITFNKPYFVVLSLLDGNSYRAKGDTKELAICEAILEAMESK